MDRLIYAVFLDPINWLATVLAKGLVWVNRLEWDHLDHYEQKGAKAVTSMVLVLGSVLYFMIKTMKG